MSKVAIAADLHAGVPGRSHDIIWACRVLREYCRLAGIDTVIILGDLFHDRVSLSVEILTMMCDFFSATKEEYKQTWIAFPGNHDMFLRHSWKINSLQVMRKYLTIIEEVSVLTLDDKRFWVIPFITHEKSYMRVLDKVVERCEQGDKLLTHIGVRSAILNTCFLLKDWSMVNFDNTPFNMVYTGHFHTMQKVGENVYYPGSLIPFKFDEGDCAHGFFVHDLETSTHKFINIWKAGNKFFPNEVPPPNFHTFLDEKLPDKTAEEVSNNMIRVMLTKEYLQDEKNEMRKRLLSLGARTVRWINFKDKPRESGEVHVPQISRDLFRTWIQSDTKGTKGMDLDLLARCHDECQKEGDDLYVSSMEEDLV